MLIPFDLSDSLPLRIYIYCSSFQMFYKVKNWIIYSYIVIITCLFTMKDFKNYSVLRIYTHHNRSFAQLNQGLDHFRMTTYQKNWEYDYFSIVLSINSKLSHLKVIGTLDSVRLSGNIILINLNIHLFIFLYLPVYFNITVHSKIIIKYILFFRCCFVIH